MRSQATLAFLILVVAACLITAFRPAHADIAVEFLNSLDKDQRRKAQLDLDDKTRVYWTFLPGKMVPRAGIALSELNSGQRALVERLLQDYLSDRGYQKTADIMMLESVLHEMEDGNPMRDPDAYFIAIYGKPKIGGTWAWSFEGHHISLNFTIAGTQITMAPRFLGASPGQVQSGEHKGLQVLGGEEDLAYSLMNAFDGSQRKKAIFSDKAYIDIVTAFATEVAPLDLVGIPYKEMTEEQQGWLKRLINEYLGTMSNSLALTRQGQIAEDGFDEVYFGWAGSTVPGKPHYYRIQGPSFLVEFDNVMGGANHVHTVWRDFDSDFGRDILRAHYSGRH